MKPLSVQDFRVRYPNDKAFSAVNNALPNYSMVYSLLVQLMEKLNDPTLYDILKMCKMLFRNRTNNLRAIQSFKYLRMSVRSIFGAISLIVSLKDNLAVSSNYASYASSVLYEYVHKAAYTALRAAYSAAYLVNEELDANLAGILPLGAELHVRCAELEPFVREAGILIQYIYVIDYQRFYAHLLASAGAKSGVQNYYVLFNDVCGGIDVCYYITQVLLKRIDLGAIGLVIGPKQAQITNTVVLTPQKKLFGW